MIKEPKYRQNQVLIQVHGTGDHRKIKVVLMGILRTQGVEDRPEFATPDIEQRYTAALEAAKWQLMPDIEAINDLARENEELLKGAPSEPDPEAEKMREAKIRARAVIFELAFCNLWDWFFTGTLDPAKYDRTNLAAWHKDLTQWLRNIVKFNYRKHYGTQKIDFLLIPELHADGKSWHMHGLLRGVPAEVLHRFELGDQMGAGIARKVLDGEPVYNWKAYADKFGFCDLEPIKDAEAVSKYCTKYITKSLQHSVTELGAHLYYHSRGLQRAQTVASGGFLGDLPKPDYKNNYCQVSWLPYSDELLNELKGQIFDERKGKRAFAGVDHERGSEDRERVERAEGSDSIPADHADRQCGDDPAAAASR